MPRTRQPRRGARNEFSVRNNSFRRPEPTATISFVSQFEQHIRSIGGSPLAKPIRHGRVKMTNLTGAEVDTAAKWLAVPGAAVHLYGKKDAPPGRKMGHVTRISRQ